MEDFRKFHDFILERYGIDVVIGKVDIEDESFDGDGSLMVAYVEFRKEDGGIGHIVISPLPEELK